MVKENFKYWDPWYIQKDKIDDIYNEVYENAKLYVKYKYRLMNNIASWRPDEIKIKILLVEVNTKRFKKTRNKNANKKACIKLEELTKKLNLIDIDNINSENISSVIGYYIYFKGSGEFAEHKDDKKIIVIRGKVSGYNFICNCSKKYFSEISSSFLRTLLDVKDIIKGHRLNIFFLGKIIGASEDPNQILILDSIYIHGDTPHVTNLYKMNKSKNE